MLVVHGRHVTHHLNIFAHFKLMDQIKNSKWNVSTFKHELLPKLVSPNKWKTQIFMLQQSQFNNI
jgi:hypothetical protein